MTKPNRETQETKFTKMVLDLRKPSEDILDSLTEHPSRCNLVHMAMGVIGEAVELHCGFAKGDRENVLEECGDIEFFLEGCRHGGHSWTIPPLERLTKSQMEHTKLGKHFKGNTTHILKCAEEVMDMVKKHCIYEKQLKLDEYRDCLQRLATALDLFYATNHIQRRLVLRDNMSKLLTGANARYKEGTYSNDQAQKRSDKE